MKKTKEPQYSCLFDYSKTEMGVMANQVWTDDPKRLVFVLSRYKFIAKMLNGKNNVLEVGCADAFGSKIVAHEVGNLQVTDFDPLFIESVHQSAKYSWQREAKVHDIVKGPVKGDFDAAYCVDVFEHVLPQSENVFIENLKLSVTERGVVIIGIPSLESQAYASPPSKAGHVNCKSGQEFKTLLQCHFSQVFIFSMNDEVIHTGFYPMAHYLFAICVK